MFIRFFSSFGKPPRLSKPSSNPVQIEPKQTQPLATPTFAMKQHGFSDPNSFWNTTLFNQLEKVMFPLGLGLFGWAGFSQYEGIQTRSWQVINGEIQKMNSWLFLGWPWISCRYSYQTATGSHTSRTVMRGHVFRRMVPGFSAFPSRNIPVFIDPSHPNRSTLIQGPSSISNFLWGLTGLLIMAASRVRAL